MSKCCHWEPHPHYLKLKNNIFMQWPIYRNQKATNGVCRGYRKHRKYEIAGDAAINTCLGLHMTSLSVCLE